MVVCVKCGEAFSLTQIVDGQRRHLRGRKYCFECHPLRRRRSPQIRVRRPIRLKTCEACGRPFPGKQVVDGKLRSLYRRRFCLECSPFGDHNTSSAPAGTGPDAAQRRKQRRNASFLRYRRKRRKSDKARLVELRGGRCEDCGYDRDLSALQFHHRDGKDKSFSISFTVRSWNSLVAEVEKCVLLCASCHRLRHVSQASSDPQLLRWRAVKQRAVDSCGARCGRCGRDGPAGLFDFHHLDPSQKSFGLARGGLWRPWEEIVAELAKCVMVCPNCHCEAHTERAAGATGQAPRPEVESGASVPSPTPASPSTLPPAA